MSVPFQPRDFFDSALLLTVRIDIDHNGGESSGTGFVVSIVEESGMTLALVFNRCEPASRSGSSAIRTPGGTSSTICR